MYNNRLLYRNESDGQPRNPALNYDGEGVCEIVLVTIFIFLWICSIHRLYSVWKNTLGFSEASIQGPQGWDLLFNWIQEMIASQKKKASLYLSDLKVFTVVTCVLIQLLYIKDVLKVKDLTNNKVCIYFFRCQEPPYQNMTLILSQYLAQSFYKRTLLRMTQELEVAYIGSGTRRKLCKR